nr:hypothetical protein [[Eubacterium] cellulosolvens]
MRFFVEKSRMKNMRRAAVSLVAALAAVSTMSGAMCTVYADPTEN